MIARVVVIKLAAEALSHAVTALEVMDRHAPDGRATTFLGRARVLLSDLQTYAITVEGEQRKQ